MSVHSEPHIRDHTNEESIVYVYVRRKTKAQFVCHHIFLQHRCLSKKSKEIALLKRRCHKKIRQQTVNGSNFSFPTYSCMHEQRIHHDKICTESGAAKLILLP